MSDAIVDEDVLLAAEVQADPERRFRWLAGIAIVAMLSAGGFAIAYLLPQSNTPEAAARSLATAITDEDVLGALDAIAPSERAIFRSTIVDVADELRRLDVLDDDADLSGVAGIDLEVDDLTLSSSRLGEGVSLVSVRGTARARVDPAKLPIGSFVDAQAELDGAEPVSESTSLEGTQLVVIEEGGRWYVSLLYTLADSLRRDAGESVPAFGHGVEPVGADTPEAAVRAMVDAAGALDARRAIALLSPDEARSLQDYAPLFLDDLEEAAAEARPSFALDVTTFDVSVDRDGDEATVLVERVAAKVRSDDDDVALEYDGRCFTLTVDGDEEETCGRPGGLGPSLLVPFTAFAFDGNEADGDASTTPEARERLVVAIVTVERGGKWYVSPLRTVLQPLVDGLRGLERKDLDALVEIFSGGVGSAEMSDDGLPAAGLSLADDRTVQSNLRNALVAFQVVETGSGEWTEDEAELAAVEPGLVITPYLGFLAPGSIGFDVDGSTMRLGGRSSSGCSYLAADRSGNLTFATDVDCGPLDAQQYSSQPWN